MENEVGLEIQKRIDAGKESLDQFLESIKAQNAAYDAEYKSIASEREEDEVDDDDDDDEDLAVDDVEESVTTSSIDTSNVSEDDSNFSEDELEELF